MKGVHMERINSDEQLVNSKDEVLDEAGVVVHICDPTYTPVDDMVWIAPAFIVRVEGAEPRMVGNLGKVNKAVVPDNHETVNLKAILDQLAGCSWFWKMDIRAAYYHIGVKKECRNLLGLSTPFGLFRNTRLPTGFNRSPGECDRFGKDKFGGVVGCHYYYDDILGGADTRNGSLQSFAQVLTIMFCSGLYANMRKLRVTTPELEYVGKQLRVDGVRPAAKHTTRFLEMAQPTGLRDLLTKLGLLEYMSDHLPGLAEVVGRFSDIRKERTPFLWTAEHTTA